MLYMQNYNFLRVCEGFWIFQYTKNACILNFYLNDSLGSNVVLEIFKSALFKFWSPLLRKQLTNAPSISITSLSRTWVAGMEFLHVTFAFWGHFFKMHCMWELLEKVIDLLMLQRFFYVFESTPCDIFYH